MNNYIKPNLEIIDSLSEGFCVVTDVVSEHEVNDRIIFEITDELD